MNPHANMVALRLPDQDQRIGSIIDREGGSRLDDTLTVRCCGHEWIGPSSVVLEQAAKHRREQHPDTLKRKRHLPRKTADAIGRANGTRVSAELRRGETT